MKIFISWSGEPSKQYAEALKKWIHLVLQGTETWISHHDIEAGARWNFELTKILNEAHYGIACITNSNHQAPWINYEAGAITKHIDNSRFTTLLFNLNPAQIKGPLSQFQSEQPTKEGIYKIISEINSLREVQLDESVLNETFEAWWPKLELSFKTIEQQQTGTEAEIEKRSSEDMLEEVLTLLRSTLNKETTIPIMLILPQVSERSKNRDIKVIEISHYASISTFLDSIYYELSVSPTPVPAYTYGTLWHIINRRTKKKYTDIGSDYCASKGEKIDSRPILNVLDIQSGDILDIVLTM